MVAERDMSGIALPFAAGVATVVLGGGLSNVSHSIYSALAFSVIVSSVIFLLHPVHGVFPSAVIRITICLCLASCGIISGIYAETASAGRQDFEVLLESAGISGRAMGAAIDSLNFRNPDTNAILKALIIGDRSDIPVHITEAFRSSGASHILALSGLHLGIIYGIVAKILSIFGNSPLARSIRSIAIILICGLYTLAVGAGPSIVRASLFILIGETATLTGRFKNTGSILMAALLIHLTIIPLDLSEVGFQLSYAAMAGIAFIYPGLRGFWPDPSGRRNPLYLIWETASLSISCQITTGPLAYMYFGTFPLCFILTNLIALPLITLIIPSSLTVLCLSSLGGCPEILTRATEALVTALSDALGIIALM